MPPVNEIDYKSLLSSLNLAVDILDRNRTPEPAFVAAYDTLKQARAMIMEATGRARDVISTANGELAA
jgi:hypothetical protein